MIRLINRWSRNKQRLAQISAQQEAMQQRLEAAPAVTVQMQVGIEEQAHRQGR